MSFDPFEIARNIDIVDLIANKYDLELVTSGRVQYVSCPLPGSSDKTPSLAIWHDDQRFHCYHCGWHGTPIDFVMGIEGYSTPVEALRHLDRLYPELQVMNPESKTRSEHVGKYFAYSEKLAAEDHVLLMGTKRYLDWVKEHRGFSEIAIKKYRLGVRSFGGVPRLTIPQTGRGGAVLSTLSRQMSPKDTLTRYHVNNVSLNPGTGRIIRKSDGYVENPIEIFRKGAYLYGFEEVNSKTILLVEGQLDVIAGWELGVDNMVAYGTMRVSDEQVLMLSPFDHVILVPDLGSALDAVYDNVKAIRMGLPAVAVSIVDLSPWKDAKLEGDEDFKLKDVNDLLRYLTASNNFNAFKNAVKDAIPVEGWLYERQVLESKEVSLSESLVKLQKLLEVATSPVTRVAIVDRASRDFGLSADLLISAR